MAVTKLEDGELKVFYKCDTTRCENMTTGFYCDDCREELRTPEWQTQGGKITLTRGKRKGKLLTLRKLIPFLRQK